MSFLIQHPCPWIVWDIFYNLKMLGKTFNRQYSEKAVLDEEIWGARKSNLSSNYLPICYVNRTFVKSFLKKVKNKQTTFQLVVLLDWMINSPIFGEDKEEDCVNKRSKPCSLYFFQCWHSSELKKITQVLLWRPVKCDTKRLTCSPRSNQNQYSCHCTPSSLKIWRSGEFTDRAAPETVEEGSYTQDFDP